MRSDPFMLLVGLPSIPPRMLSVNKKGQRCIKRGHVTIVNLKAGFDAPVSGGRECRSYARMHAKSMTLNSMHLSRKRCSPQHLHAALMNAPRLQIGCPALQRWTVAGHSASQPADSYAVSMRTPQSRSSVTLSLAH